MRSAQRCRSRRTAGSAFSWTTSDALVCCKNTVHRPVRTPARATARRTSPVTSCSPRPRAGRSISSCRTVTEETLHPRSHLDVRPRRQRPAAHQPRAEEKLRPVADRRERPLERIEPLDELDEALIDAQVIRRIPAGDEQADVVLWPDLIDSLVGLDLLLPSVPLQLHAGLRPDD